MNQFMACSRFSSKESVVPVREMRSAKATVVRRVTSRTPIWKLLTLSVMLMMSLGRQPHQRSSSSYCNGLMDASTKATPLGWGLWVAVCARAGWPAAAPWESAAVSAAA